MFQAHFSTIIGPLKFPVTFSGPFFHHYMPMETIRGNEFTDTKTPNTVHGRSSLADGKVGRCVNLDGRRDYIDLGDQVRTV